jgi:hypothetical protein
LAKPSKAKSTAARILRPPLNLSKANSAPSRRATGRGRGSDS